MPSPTTCLYEKTMQSVLSGLLPEPAACSLSAHLMVPAFIPNQTTQETFADIAAHEMSWRDYSARAVTGAAIMVNNGVWSLTSDPIIFGDPVTVPPFRFMVMAYGAPAAPPATKQLLLCADLVSGGGALEATRGALKIEPPTAGWFAISTQ